MRERYERDMQQESQVHWVVIAILAVLLTVLIILMYNVGDR